MKKFLFWATVVGASLTGCVNDVETVLSPEDNPQPITFEVGKYKPSSRATIEFDKNLTFGTFSFYHAVSGTNHSFYIDNEEVKYFGTYWSTQAVHYWPESGAHLDFISYHPYEAYVTVVDGEGNPLETTLSSAVPKFNNELTTLSYIGYEVDELNPKDLLYSDKAINQRANTMFNGVTGVPTLFHHALAKLSFKVRVQRYNNAEISPDAVTTWSIALNSIKLSNIHNKGNVVLNTVVEENKSTLGWRKGEVGDPQVWTSLGQTIDRTWNAGGQLLTTATKGEIVGVSTSDKADNYLVMPQTLLSETDVNPQSITLNYSITTTTPQGQSATVNKIVTKPFSLFTSILAWEMGKHIVYLIDIDPAGDVIHFAPYVEDWTLIDNSGNDSGFSGKLDF